MDIEKVEYLKSKLDACRPLSQGVVQNLRDGRIARILMNLELIKSGYPPVVIRVEDRLKYYQALDKAHATGDYSLFLELMEEWEEKSFEPYFYVLGI